MGETEKYRTGLIERGIKFSSSSFGTDTHTFFDIEIGEVRCQIDFYEFQTTFGSGASLRVSPYGDTDANTALKLIDDMVSYESRCEHMQEPFDGVCQYLRRMRELGIEVNE